jgi:ADP-heptose:LPS heptosyltransferase
MPTGIVSELPEGANVVVLRLRSLGDVVLTTPALSLLKQARPDLRITVVLAESFRGLLDGNSDVSRELFHGGGRFSTLRTLRAIRELKPALCLDLYGKTWTSRWTGLSGARFRAGFAHARESFAYGIKIPRAQEVLGLAEDAPVHTAEHLASAMFHLGVPVMDVPRAKLYVEPQRRERPYAVLHVAALFATKEWPIDRFRAMGAFIEKQCGLEPVFVSAPGRGEMFADLVDFTCLDNLTLGGLKSLIAGARLFVGNDSGPAHVAAAFGVPTVAIFGSSDSRIWGPWRTVSAVVETEWDCKPCKGDRCYEFDEPRCILSVEGSRVEKAIDDVLARSAS